MFGDTNNTYLGRTQGLGWYSLYANSTTILKNDLVDLRVACQVQIFVVPHSRVNVGMGRIASPSSLHIH